jgi:transcriptional regulator with XRE-family HTH domain
MYIIRNMNKLKKVLEQQGVTQSELARQLKVSRQRVNRWVRGLNDPDKKQIPIISAYLKVSIEKLFFDEE